jgi:hypothetical protein
MHDLIQATLTAATENIALASAFFISGIMIG